MPSLVEIGPVVLEKKIFKCRQCIFSMWLLSPLEKCIALNLNKFEFPLPKNTLCHVWLKSAHRFWRRFSKVVNFFFNFCYYLPLEKGQGPSFERNWIPLTQGCSVPSLVEIGLVVLENKSSMCFHYVAFISLWQKAWPFIGTNLNRLHLGMPYVKRGGTWLGDSEEVNIWKGLDGHLNRFSLCIFTM